MPELPEVEIAARQLHGWLVGRLLVDVELLDPGLLSGAWAARGPAALQPLVGARVDAVGRRGKNLLIRVGGLCLHLHLRMTGQLVRGFDLPRFARLRLSPEGAPPVTFVDPRRFGTLQPLDADAERALEASLGPEPWPDRRSGAWWAARFAGARAPIKVALLDQSRVAGLGNILATEALWSASLAPDRSAASLRPEEWARLAEAVPACVDHVLAVESAEALTYVNQGGVNPFAVYGRAGEPCPRCGAPIHRFVQAGRGTWWCPACAQAAEIEGAGRS